jgi:hypothetical protein
MYRRVQKPAHAQKRKTQTLLNSPSPIDDAQDLVLGAAVGCQLRGGNQRQNCERITRSFFRGRRNRL